MKGRQPNSKKGIARENKQRVQGMKTEDLKLLAQTLHTEIAKASSLLFFAEKEIKRRKHVDSDRYKKRLTEEAE